MLESVRSQLRRVCDVDGIVLLSSPRIVIQTNILTLEYMKIVRAVGVGFVMMGVVGYAVKLLHIPIRYLIV